MLVRLEIITERRPGALVVPKRALRREGSNVNSWSSPCAASAPSPGSWSPKGSPRRRVAAGSCRRPERALGPASWSSWSAIATSRDGSEVQIAADGELAADHRPSVIADATARTDGQAAEKAEPAPTGEPAAETPPVLPEPAKQETPPPAQDPAPAKPASDGGGH